MEQIRFPVKSVIDFPSLIFQARNPATKRYKVFDLTYYPPFRDLYNRVARVWWESPMIRASFFQWRAYHTIVEVE